MRVFALTAGLVLAVVAGAAQAKTDAGLCRVVCAPETQPAPTRPAPARPAPVRSAPVRSASVRRAAVKRVRHAVRRHVRHFARSDSYYSYRETENAASDSQGESHGKWYAAPNDAVIPGPAGPAIAAYPPPGYPAPGYPPPPGPDCDCGQSVHIDEGGWTGGVGYAAAGGGFMDGYGVMHYGGFANGPTYNSYRQSFQFNSSMPGPFQPRMGGFAPRR